MIELLDARRQIDPTDVSTDGLAIALHYFYHRKYVIRAKRTTPRGSGMLDAETRDLIDTTARFVSRMDDQFRAALRTRLEGEFDVTADERQRSMGLSYITADLDKLVAVVVELSKPAPATDRVAEAHRVAAAGAEQLLCGTRTIRKISDALGFDDPESIAAKVDTQALQKAIADLIVAEVQRANGR